LGALAAISVECFFGFPMRVFPTAALFLWLACCAVPFRPAPASGMIAGRILAVVFSVSGLWVAARLAAADSYLGAGADPFGGLARMESGVKLLPGQGELHFRLALKLIGTGRMDEAAAHLMQAMPGFKDPDVQFNLGWIALRQKRYQESITWFREGLRLYPYYRPQAWRDLGLAYRGAGMGKEAREAEARAALPPTGVPPSR